MNAEPDGRPDGPRGRVGDVVVLEIEEGFLAEPGDLLDERRTLGGEELHPHFEDAGLGELDGQRQRFGLRSDIQRDDDLVFDGCRFWHIFLGVNRSSACR